MLGAAGKVQNQDQNFMLVFDGPQDIGKSFLANWLCPLPEYFIEGPIQPDGKDSYLRLIRHFIWEVGELQSTTRKADREALKNFITTIWVTVRKPFGRYDLKKPACASFIGTINESGSGFLDDRTGNRRFAVVNVKHIDWAYTNLDVHQLWAEVMDAYRRGDRGTLTLEQKREQARINAGYGSLSTVEEYLWAFYAIDRDEGDWVPAREILTTLELNGLSGNQRANLMELGQILKSRESEGVIKGRPKIDSVKTTSYKGIRKIF
jgi:predicted P-loop ATPase